MLGGIIDSLRTVHDTVHQLWPHKMTTFIAKLSGSESDQSRNAMVSEVLNTLMVSIQHEKKGTYLLIHLAGYRC